MNRAKYQALHHQFHSKRLFLSTSWRVSEFLRNLYLSSFSYMCFWSFSRSFSTTITATRGQISQCCFDESIRAPAILSHNLKSRYLCHVRHHRVSSWFGLRFMGIERTLGNKNDATNKKMLFGYHGNGFVYFYLDVNNRS